MLTETLNARLEEVFVQSVGLDAKGLRVDCVSDKATNVFQMFCTNYGLASTCEDTSVCLTDPAEIEFFLRRACKINLGTMYQVFPEYTFSQEDENDSQESCLIC